MNLSEWFSVTLFCVGALFFLAGTVALLRFPDVYSRLHALAKADSLGLGCIVLALLPLAETPALQVKLVLVWILALIASAVVSFLIARRAQRRGVPIWQSGETHR